MTISAGDISILAGNGFWLKANTLALADNDPVDLWADSSAAGNDALGTADTRRPLFKTNVINTTLPVVRFDGVNDLLVLDTAAVVFSGVDKPISVVAVRKYANLTTDYVWLSFGNSADTDPMHYIGNIGSTSLDIFRRDDAVASAEFAEGTPDTNFAILSAIFSGTTLNVFINGSQIGTVDFAMDVGAMTVDECTLGALQRITAVQHAPIDIPEVICGDSAFSALNRQRLEWYLAEKYAISGPTDPDAGGFQSAWARNANQVIFPGR